MPMHGTVFLDNLRRALVQIGYSEEQAGKYLFHGWRHFFTSYMINKLDKKLLKGETGHKTDIMLNHYSDHQTVGERELIQARKRETFAGLIPENAMLLQQIECAKYTAA
jgi:integrase